MLFGGKETQVECQVNLRKLNYRSCCAMLHWMRLKDSFVTFQRAPTINAIEMDRDAIGCFWFTDFTALRVRSVTEQCLTILLTSHPSGASANDRG